MEPNDPDRLKQGKISIASKDTAVPVIHKSDKIGPKIKAGVMGLGAIAGLLLAAEANGDITLPPVVSGVAGVLAGIGLIVGGKSIKKKKE